MMLTRRRVLLGSASVCAVAAAGGAFAVATSTRETFLRRLLARSLGPFEMSQSDFSRFAESFEATVGDAFGDEDGLKWRLVRVAERLASLDTLAAQSEDIDGKLDEFARALLAHFYVTTDVARRPNEAAPITFYGDFPCRNPFAQLAPPA